MTSPSVTVASRRPPAGRKASGAAARGGLAPRPVSARVRRRGRFVAPLLAVCILGLGVTASVEPFQDLRRVRATQAEMAAQVALLEQENAAISTQISRLEQDSTLEALARSELNLARPGEDVYIVSGTAEAPAPVEAEPATSAGPFERLVESIRRLF